MFDAKTMQPILESELNTYSSSNGGTKIDRRTTRGEAEHDSVDTKESCHQQLGSFVNRFEIDLFSS